MLTVIRPFLLTACMTICFTSCAQGPILQEPEVSQSALNEARQALLRHQIAPSLNLDSSKLDQTLSRIWNTTKPSIVSVCSRIFSQGCADAARRFRVVVVPDPSINAYADASTFTIGLHAGLLQSVGSDDEIAAVLAHEAAHLLFGHAQKKGENALQGAMVGMVAGIVAGAALYQPGMDGQYIGDLGQAGWDAGSQLGYIAYSPEMEIEADQFAMYVLAASGRRLSAGLDLIIRLHRGDVPDPVRRVDGWAGYLATHPAHDYRLAAMHTTLWNIEKDTQPTSEANTAKNAQEMAQRIAAGYVPTLVHQDGVCGELRRKYKDCEWWNGEPMPWAVRAGVFWPSLWRCPQPDVSPLIDVGQFVPYDTWTACLR